MTGFGVVLAPESSDTERICSGLRRSALLSGKPAVAAAELVANPVAVEVASLEEASCW